MLPANKVDICLLLPDLFSRFRNVLGFKGVVYEKDENEQEAFLIFFQGSREDFRKIFGKKQTFRRSKNFSGYSFPVRLMENDSIMRHALKKAGFLIE